jgi:hypothetical protein
MECWPGLPWNTGPASRGILARHHVESWPGMLWNLQASGIDRGVIDVDVGPDLVLLLHEAQVRVRNGVAVQPLDSLTHRVLMEEMDKEATGDNPDPIAFIRQSAKRAPRSWNGSRRCEKVPLSHGEAVQLLVLIPRLDPPALRAHKTAIPSGYGCRLQTTLP